MRYFLKINFCLLLLHLAGTCLLNAQNPCGPPGNVLPVLPAEPSREGQVLRYSPDGHIQAKLHYLHNHLEGVQEYYYGNGKISESITCSRGAQTGPARKYYESGILKTETNYYDNKREGAFTDYYPSGKKEAEGTFTENILNGKYTYYYENGQVQYTLTYDHGKIINDKDASVYYPDGKPKRTEQYKGGKRTGNWKCYYEDGKLSEEGSCRNGHMGTVVEYYDNGNVKSAVHFKLLTEKNTEDISIPTTTNIELYGTKLYFDEQEQPVKKETYNADVLLRVTHLTAANNKWNLVFHADDNGGVYDSVKNAPAAEGEFTGEVYHFNSITDHKGKKLLKNGNGNYFGPYCLVNDPDEFAELDYKNWYDNSPLLYYYLLGGFNLDWQPLYNVHVRSRYETDRTNYVTPVFAMAKGQFKNGLKEGEWLEGNFFEDGVFSKKNDTDPDPGLKPRNIALNDASNCYAQGNYVAGKKEGIWKLVDGDVIFEGMYKNGKRTGEWKTREREPKKVIKKDDPLYYGDYYYYSNNYRPFVKGNYTDGKPDGTWIIFMDHTDTVVQEQLYNNGNYLGISKEFYPSHQLKMQGVKSGDTLLRTYYTPLGDRVNFLKDNFDDFCATKNGQRNGNYYAWDYRGRITLTGSYINGLKEGRWRGFSENGDTVARYTYVHDLLEGSFEEETEYGMNKGIYVRDQREGEWMESSAVERKICFYKNGEQQLLQYWDRAQGEEKQLIKDGSGFLTATFSVGGNPHDIKTEEFYFINGFIAYYKKYYSDGLLQSWQYRTPRGDSLVIYNSPFGGQCVSSGEGVVTDYDNYNRIETVFFYEGGRLQKKEHYNEGKFSYTEINFPSKYDKQPVIKRTFTKISDNVYNVKVSVSELNGIKGFQRLIEKLPTGYEAGEKENAVKNVLFKKAEFKHVWTDNDQSDFSIEYILKIPANARLIRDYEGNFAYIREGHTVSVFINGQNLAE